MLRTAPWFKIHQEAMLASVLQIPNEPEPVADQTENLAAAV